MAKRNGSRVEIHNLNKVRRELRRAGTDIDKAALKKANKEVSDLVTGEAKRNINSKSGNLAKHTVSRPTRTQAVVRSGTKVKAPYAGVNHWGWPGRFRGSNYVAEAIATKWKRIRKSYEKNVQKILNRL